MAQVLDLSSLLPPQVMRPIPAAPAPAPTSPVAPAPAPVRALGRPASVSTPLTDATGAALPNFQPGMVAPQPQSDPNASPLHQMLSSLVTPADPNVQRVADLTTAPSAMDYFRNFVTGSDAGKAALDERARTSQIFAHPDVKNYLLNNPEAVASATADGTGMAGKFQTALQAAMAAQKDSHTYAHVNGTNFDKTPQAPDHVNAQAAILGEHPKNVLPFMEPHQFSDDEFVQATQGLNWKQAARIFGMQHYQTPQQQLIPQLVGHAHDLVQQAQAAYENAVAKKLPPADQKAASDALKQAQQERDGIISKLTEGAQSIFSNASTSGDQ